MKRLFYLLFGFAAAGLGTLGLVVPLLPTVPFMILAAFCFARSSPQLERRIVQHPRIGPHIIAWRERRAISRKGKSAAVIAFAVSALLGLWLLPFPVQLLPLFAALVGGSWILGRPNA